MICPTVSKHPAARLLFSHLLFSHVDSPTDIRGGCASYPTSSSVHKFRHVCLQIMSVFVPLGPRGKKNYTSSFMSWARCPTIFQFESKGSYPDSQTFVDAACNDFLGIYSTMGDHHFGTHHQLGGHIRYISSRFITVPGFKLRLVGRNVCTMCAMIRVVCVYVWYRILY